MASTFQRVGFPLLKGTAFTKRNLLPFTPSRTVFIVKCYCTSKKGFENGDRSHVNNFQGGGTSSTNCTGLAHPNPNVKENYSLKNCLYFFKKNHIPILKVL